MLTHLLIALIAILTWEAACAVLRAMRPVAASVPAPVAPVLIPDEISALDVERASGRGHSPVWEFPLQANGVSAGFDAFLYATRGRVHDTKHMTPAQRQWLARLSEEELVIAAGYLPAKLDAHMAGKRMARGLPAVRPIRPPPTMAEIASAARAARK